MNILLLEPYFSGSHKAWAKGYTQHSQHQVDVLSTSGHFWKWRMHGGAVTLARKFMDADLNPDLLLATDMLDLPTFLALTRTKTAQLPTAIYFHENQLSYPWSPDDRDVAQQRDKHYGFINFVSALAADAVLFNSQYHLDSFLSELSRLLKHFPDYNELKSVEQVKAKSSVLPLGLNLERFDAHRVEIKNNVPLILWNHRWEYDKNPTTFFSALHSISKRGLDFEVAILGKSFRQQPEEFVSARETLGTHIIHIGYANNFTTYAAWLWRADLLPVTSNQDFFGISVMQAIYCNGYPLLPKRLAYPELIPTEVHSHYFYNDYDDLVDRLDTALRDIENTRQQSLRPVAAQYDWSNMAPLYDSRLEQIKNSYQN